MQTPNLDTQELFQYLQLSNSQTRALGIGLTPGQAAIWHRLFKTQNTIPVGYGNFLEIGVEYGLSSMMFPLYCTSRESEKIVLVDTSYRAEVKENLLKTIEQNLYENKIIFLEIDSFVVHLQQKLAGMYGTFRWIHIDGEHSYDAVINDLNLASLCASRAGIIAVDDFFNFASVGITQAVFNWLNINPGWHLFLCSENKAYLARSKYMGLYKKNIYSNILNLYSYLGLSAMLVNNGWSHETSYISVVPKKTGHSYQGIGYRSNQVPNLF